MFHVSMLLFVTFLARESLSFYPGCGGFLLSGTWSYSLDHNV
jgi:hypothetical protein